MARSLALPSGLPARETRATSPLSARRAIRRLADWLSRSLQHDVEREIATYLEDRGVDHFTDSIERDIESRFLARQAERF